MALFSRQLLSTTGFPGKHRVEDSIGIAVLILGGVIPLDIECRSPGIVQIRGNMVALRLLRLIETQSDEITTNVATKIHMSARRIDVQEVPKFELLIFVRDLLQNLKEWLLNNTKTEIETHYRDMGARLTAKEVPLAPTCWIVVITKEHLWRYLQEQVLLVRSNSMAK